MDFKKKMGTGILAGALGLSLVGGGTYAAFNDVEEIDNFFSAGTLDLVTSTDVLFDISNLKPGDHITETLTLTNNGSLEIDEILLNGFASGWEDVLHTHLTDNGKNSKAEFLSQFQVEVLEEVITLNDLVNNFEDKEITFEGTETPALVPGESMDLEVKVTFVEDDTRYDDSRLFEQNKYQGEGATINLRFEATQMPGEERSNDAQ
ncbi:TasA family protein [Oceanobacillus salinisoli]|uniref:TasA family protein n=1 Tax=Oceanobacillus salinisoli TaxID=2678611 RepID=UPI0012E27C83|nr:TasA family protein [Oceanobacillus salinisoli]